MSKLAARVLEQRLQSEANPHLPLTEERTMRVVITKAQARELLMAISEYRFGCVDNGMIRAVAVLDRAENAIRFSMAARAESSPDNQAPPARTTDAGSARNHNEGE